MISLWNDADASAVARACASPDLGLCVYASRLLGAHRALVLHGGGNTSVKTQLPNVFGESEDVLWVKGSGSDLAQVGGKDFAALRLRAVRRLIELDALDTAAMADALAGMTLRAGPRASIETILHAILPWPHVHHTHADAILALGNTANGARILQEVFGELAPLVPFRSSGFELAKACWTTYREQGCARTIGLVLHHHGVIAFGHSARECYENMLQLVTRAEQHLASRGAWALPHARAAFAVDPVRIAWLRRQLCEIAGFPLLLERQDDEVIVAFAQRADLAQLSVAGPATPQHAVFIKREPQLGLDVDAYARRYTGQVASVHPGQTLQSLQLDAAPRVVIDPVLGVWIAAIDERHLRLTADILQQDVEIKTRASSHDTYVGLPLADLLHAEIHYGGFERKLRAAGAPLLGESVAVYTAAPQPLLEAALRAAGAAVTYIDPARALDAQLEALVLRHGGIDVLIAESTLGALTAFAPLLEQAPRGGRIVVLDAAGVTCDDPPNVTIAQVDGVGTSLDPAKAGLVAALCLPAAAALQPRLTFPSSRASPS